MSNIIGLGTEFKININIEPIGYITMDDYDFNIEVYCSPKRAVVISKEKSVRVDKDNYIILVDSNDIGVGDVKAKVTTYLPDEDFEDGTRTNVSFLSTDIKIVK
jgi:hypothetical protein